MSILAEIKKHFPEAQFVGLEPMTEKEHSATVDADGFCMICEGGGNGCDACAPTVAGQQSRAPISDAEVAQLKRYAMPSRACANCQREALPNLNYKGAPICTACAPYAGALPMITTDMEAEALEIGGQAGGAYLEEIEKYDLAELSPVEWTTFLSRILEGYGAHMREAAKTTAPF